MDIPTQQVRLVPRAVSLNSFNGFYQSQGQDYFFKTHIEEQGTIHEYYHAQLLEQAGYNVVRPLRLLHEKERQMVIYPLVQWPVLFDLLHAQETGQGLPAGIDSEQMYEAEREECQHLLDIYARTFQPEQDTSQAPVHQLFWLRLAGGRFQQFYARQQIPLPGKGEAAFLSFEEIAQARWRINGVEQSQTLAALIAHGTALLDPQRPAATVIGHGDAHSGNVFLEEGTSGRSNEQTVASHPVVMAKTRRYLYFDPAFAGRHSPLLDIVKPLFHNIFATWMYFPQEVARDLALQVTVTDGWIDLQHNYQLSPLRQTILHIKQEYLLKPLLAWLEEHKALPENWEELLRLALMCCPLLTVDLFDQEKRPAQIGWLGLAQAVQLGNAGIDPWKEEKR